MAIVERVLRECLTGVEPSECVAELIFDCEPTEIVIQFLSGGDLFAPCLRACIPQYDGYILVYETNDTGALEFVEELYEDIVRIRGTRDVPIVLCGNKCDLESKRTVSTSEGEELAQRMGVVFYETSALADINIQEMFYTLARDIVDWKAREGNKEAKDDEEIEVSTKHKRKCCLLL